MSSFIREKKCVSDALATPSRNRLALPERSPSKLAVVSLATQRSPIKTRRGVTLAQKQALIDNLQLEITERARRLRAQYNLQAQGLRSRVEIRINRIPMALRKVKMGDLVRKYAEQLLQQEQLKKRQQEREQRQRELRGREQQRKLLGSSRAPPVPPKDYPRPASPLKMLIPTQGRTLKRTSDGFDKENDAFENPKKRPRGTPAGAAAQEHVQALSPASSNSRLALRDWNEKEMTRPAPPTSHPTGFPTRSVARAVSRPASPIKSTPAQTSRPGAAGVLASMVERAKATRGAAARKPTVSSATSSSGASAAGRTTRRGAPGTAAGRRGAGAATAASTATTGRPAKRVSDSSDGSSSTVVKKPAGKARTGAAAPAPAKRTVMGTIRKGVAGAAGAASKRAAAPSGAGSTRVLRRRG